MNTKIRGLRLNDDDWKGLQRLSYVTGYSDVTALIRAIARDELVVSKVAHPSGHSEASQAPAAPVKTIFPEEETTYDKNFDWGA